MAQPVTAILAHQNELAAKALNFTGDWNEASFLVGKVMLGAFYKIDHGESAENISAALPREMDALIQQIKRS
jgi:hypothetical protein